MTPSPQDARWHELATKASTEMDGEKLMILVEQLCSAFDERHAPVAAQKVKEVYLLPEPSRRDQAV